ncbi:hypothetical protein [Nonomuraea sp. NPDC049480]|uniref:hypothetical protein n=1 Tax=Nonomuraea sp. NPDC049480 TaxID=3364353 RepID=UPI0037A8598D
MSIGSGGAGPVAVVDLGPAEPAAQRLVLHAEPLRDPSDHTGRGPGLLANLKEDPHRTPHAVPAGTSSGLHCV